MSAAGLDNNNSNINQLVNPQISDFIENIINLDDDNENKKKVNNNSQNDNQINQSINKLIQFTQSSFNKLNTRFDSLEKRQNNLENYVCNMNKDDDDKSAYYDRINNRIKKRKDK